MKYSSIQQIKEHFGLIGNEKKEIRNELKLKLASLHPDKVGSKNFNLELYTEVNEAIEFLDSLNTNLVPVDQVSDLIQIVKDLTISKKTNVIETQFNESIDAYNRERKEALFLPKITLSIITALLSFLWLFPTTVEDHPVLKNYINFENEISTIIWIILLIYTSSFWIIIYRIDQKNKRISKSIKTERVQNKLLIDFKNKFQSNSFEKNDFTEFILEEYGNRRRGMYSSMLLIMNSGIDQEAAENLSNLIIDKAKKKEILIELNNSSTSILDDRFEWK